MTASDRQSSWQVFSEIREITTKEGTIFYLLLSPDRRNVCRIDERFTPLIHEEFQALVDGNIEEIEIYCRPDINDPYGWRLDVDYYRGVATGKIDPQPRNSPPQQLSIVSTAPALESDQKNVTFCISVDDHTFVSALHKRFKQLDPAFSRFQDFNAYLYATQLRLLRLQHPDLIATRQVTPF